MFVVRLFGPVFVGILCLAVSCAENDPVQPEDDLGPGALVQSSKGSDGLCLDFKTVLSGEFFGVDTPARGRASLRFDEALSELRFTLLVNNIEDVTGAELIAYGRLGAVVSLYAPGGAPTWNDRMGAFKIEGTITSVDSKGVIETLADLRAAMINGATMVRVRSAAYPDGEIGGPVLPPRSADSPWPLMLVHDRHYGSFYAVGLVPMKPLLEVPDGFPLRFRLWADASRYGSAVKSYRYYWTTGEEQAAEGNGSERGWVRYDGAEIDLEIAPPRGAPSGEHDLAIQVRDDRNNVSRVELAVRFIPLTLERPLLVIDDCREGSSGFGPTSGGAPSDVEHDAFWNEMGAVVAGFDPSIDVVEANSGLSLSTLARYRSVIWVSATAYNTGAPSFIHDVIRFRDPLAIAIGTPGPVVDNFLARFMEAGGRTLLCGEQILTASINRESYTASLPAFPIIFRYELGGDQDGDYFDSQTGVRGIADGSFGYLDGCVNVLDIAYISSPLSIRRPPCDACPVHLVRPAPQSGFDDGLRTAIPAPGSYDFPVLELRPEAASPGKAWASLGLNCDIYNPPYFETVCAAYTEYGRTCFEPIYGNGCSDPDSKIYNAPVAFWTSAWADRIPAAGGAVARSAVWGFSPVYFKPAQVKAAMEIIFFDEWNLPRNFETSRDAAMAGD